MYSIPPRQARYRFMDIICPHSMYFWTPRTQTGQLTHGRAGGNLFLIMLRRPLPVEICGLGAFLIFLPCDEKLESISVRTRHSKDKFYDGDQPHTRVYVYVHRALPFFCYSVCKDGLTYVLSSDITANMCLPGDELQREQSPIRITTPRSPLRLLRLAFPFASRSCCPV